MTPRRFFRETNGATAIEFALISIVMFTMTFGIIEFGRLLYIQHALNFGAERAARLLYIDSTANEDELRPIVVESIFLIDPDDIDVALSEPVSGSTDGFTTRRLIVTYPFVSLVPSLVLDEIELSSMRDVVVSVPVTVPVTP